MGLVFGDSQAISGGVDMRNRILALMVVLFSGGMCLAACPSADLNGDCLVNFLDFHLMAAQGNFLDLDTMASQWLESGENDAEGGMLTILGRVDIQTAKPNSFAVEFVVVDKQRVDRTVFAYKCEVILENMSSSTFENVQLVMVSWPDNMTIIDPHVSFGDARIGPGESAASIDTCTFTVDRSESVNPVEIVWHYVTPPEDMVFIPGGTFVMGDNLGDGYWDELPVHTVTVDSFYIGKYEMTNRQYCDYLNSAMAHGLLSVRSGIVYIAGLETTYPYCDTSTSSSLSQIAYSGGVFTVRSKAGRSMVNDPMVRISWYGAVAYCNWRSQQEGKEQCYNLSTWNCDFLKRGYRLATEAEWEYAARGGLARKRFPWGNDIYHAQANYHSSTSYSYDKGPTRGYHPLWNDGIEPYTSPVGFFDGTMKYKAGYNWPGSSTSYQTASGANNYGLYDMAGNVFEWCNDWYSGSYYSSTPPNNPTGPTTGTYRVLRGSGWNSDAISCRVANRVDFRPGNRDGNIGFRVVLDFQECETPLVDDMESYNTPWVEPANNIYEIWRDGIGNCTPGSGNATGSMVNENIEVFVGGAQSMRYDYDNDGMVFNPCTMTYDTRPYLYSKAEAQIAALPSGIGPNWNPCDTTLLVLNFYGQPDNVVDEVDPLWVELKDTAGNSAKAVYGDGEGEDPQHLTEASWHEWVIDMADFSEDGVDVTDLASVAIGVGWEDATAPGGSGTLNFDEIRLATSR
jgi:formylglycine-generating enzyme required for sulfatase activity